MSPAALRGFLEWERSCGIRARGGQQTPDCRNPPHRALLRNSSGCCKRRLTSKLVMLTLPKDICARARKLVLPGGAVRGAIGRHPKLIRHLRYPRSSPTYFPAGVGSRCFGRRTCVPVSFSQISTHSAPANGKWWLPFPPNFSLPGDKSLCDVISLARLISPLRRA